VSFFALLLAAAKAAAGFATGSIALLSSALDSGGDMLASFANFIFLTIAAKPPDEGHHFGHGKAEHLAALLQGTIILGSAVFLGMHAIERIRQPVPIESSVIAIGVMVLSIFATVAITSYLKRHSGESSALHADSLHYTSDIVSNLATIAALIVVRVSGNPLFDSILGVSVACWIGWNSLYLIWNAANDLMDRALPPEEVGAIIEAIERAHPAITGYRDLRTRRAAGIRFVDFDLLIDNRVSFEEAHEVTELVKERISVAFPHVMINAHAEPVCVTHEFIPSPSEGSAVTPRLTNRQKSGRSTTDS
ncbi:MAG TPA: cation diffusion facilitator family transporter, partial [Thermoanaerobaculia bacterium]|nr:cation diffusion facilitator family transporter [Thermoanaerobaculia bacterium]